MATVLVLIFSTVATTEENYKVTSASLALLVDGVTTERPWLLFFGWGEGSKVALVTGSVVRTCRCLHHLHRQDTVGGE